MIHAAAWILTTAAALTGPEGIAERAAAPGRVELPGCFVELIDEVHVPAREPGVLDALEAKEGLEVERDMVLGHIDDAEAKMELAVAQDDYKIAQVQADNDVSVRLAEKASLVARMDYEQVREANDKQRGAVSLTELRGRLFEYERTKLAIEESQHQRTIDGLTANAKNTQVNAAQMKVDHRIVKSPIDGVIVEVFLREGEWVNPGDPIFRVIGLKKLRVKGKLDAAQYDLAEVSNRPVKVTVQLARRRQAEFNGKIVFVNPENNLKGEFGVWAEVENRQENGQWLLRPEMRATMTIELRDRAQLGAAGVATPVQTAER